MARFSDEVLERLKSEISLVRLLESQGHTLKKHGKDYILSCPFHDDDTPSLVVSPGNNLWHCMGACQEGGSVIDWVMKSQGVSFRHAVEILQDDLSLVSESKPVKRTTTKKLVSPLAAQADAQKLLHQVIDYYHETLKQSPEALEYLASRGLNHVELIERFQLGFANRTLGYRLPEKNRKAGAEIRGKLQSLGVYRASGHEHLSGSLVVPIINEQNHVTEIYGRKLLGNRLRKGTAQHLYLPGAHQGVWNIEAFKASDEIILCEALIDAMTFWVNGFRNVTASYGTSGFIDDHLKALKEHSIKRVLIAYDRDEAGDKAADTLATKLMAEGIDCYRVLFPKGMDVNAYALKVTPAVKSLSLVLRKAIWLGKGKAPAMDTVEIIDKHTGEIIEPPIESNIEQAKTLPPLAAKEVTQKTRKVTHPEETNEPNLPATPVPASPTTTIDAEVKEHEVIITLGERRYRIRGLEKNLSYDLLKVNVMVSSGEHFHTDKLDFYNAKARTVFINQVSVECCVKGDVIKKDLGKILLKLEALQENLIQQALTPQKKMVVDIAHDERQEALALLNDKDLFGRILDDFNSAGVVGEDTNKLCGYLACVSRKLDKPLAILIQSSSAAGKSSLMDAILAMMPEEERVQYSAMTGQSLFYMGETHLKHKILAIAEEEGAEHASYALKLLQSEGQITIASTGKNATTGNLETQEYHVEGPVMLFLTTTAIDIDEELLNRCLVLTVNESHEQTEAIHREQRFGETLEGLLTKNTRKKSLTVHRNAQRLLKPLTVVNPFAESLTFLSHKTRTRRDHQKYLMLIRSIALLHQYQRELKTVNHLGEELTYIEATLDDIGMANQLAHAVLGQTLDELPPQTRKLLKHIQQMVQEGCTRSDMEQSDYRFSRKDIRAFTNWGNTQLKVHCKRLEDLEYLLTHRGGRGQAFEYELLFDTEEPEQNSHLMGLIDIEKLRCDEKKSGARVKSSVSSRPQVGGVSELQKSLPVKVDKGHSESGFKNLDNTTPGKKLNGTHHNHNHALAEGVMA